MILITDPQLFFPINYYNFIGNITCVRTFAPITNANDGRRVCSICKIRDGFCESFEKSREIKQQTFNYFAFRSGMFNQQKWNVLPSHMTYCAFHHNSQLGVMRSTKRNYKLQHVPPF